MLERVWMGLVAGAVGTVALNVATYADIALRGRPSSSVPAKAAEKIATLTGVDLAPAALRTAGQHSDEQQQAHHRQQGLGALMGYGAGLGVGALYGLLHLGVDQVPVPVAAVALGAAAMAAGDLPPISLGVTDPKEWGTSGWLADIVPHLLYGLAAAVTFETLSTLARPRCALHR